MMLLPMAWADYFGRESYGAIRGVALSMQVTAQAAGPLVSGLLRDWSGHYTDSLLLFGGLAALAVVAALAARRPVDPH
jgi:cyanate permease